MTTFTLTCSLEHEPMTWTVEADSKEAAADMFLAMDELKSHIGSAHPDMMNKSPEEMKAAVLSMIA